MPYNLSIVVSDAPPMERWNDILGDYHPEGEDTWVTDRQLLLNRDVPGIPPLYETEQVEGRVLYVCGIPAGWAHNIFRTVFIPFGNPLKSPCLISAESGDTFRWLIMESEQEAMLAMELLQGRKLMSSHLVICPALKPGRTVSLVSGEWIGPTEEKNEAWKKENIPTEKTFHSHPPTITQNSPSSPHRAKDEPFVELSIEEQFKLNMVPDGQIRHRPRPTPTIEITPAVPTIIEPASPEPAPLTNPRTRAVSDSNDGFITQAASWANIAKSANPETRMVDLHPKPRNISGPRLRPVGRIPKVTSISHRSDTGETVEEQMRVVFLLNLPNTITLQDVSNAVKEGPLAGIVFGRDDQEGCRFCGVIFQHAEDAGNFFDALKQEAVERRPDRFRFIVDVARGDPFPADEAIKAMGQAPCATRRLTIVKGGFFFMFGERQMRDLCSKLVGAEHVQLIWLYNGGNATIVFSGVEYAMKVKHELDRRASGAGVPGGTPAMWAGLQTTYSKDPCIFPLELKTAMHD